MTDKYEKKKLEIADHKIALANHRDYMEKKIKKDQKDEDGQKLGLQRRSSSAVLDKSLLGLQMQL